MRNKELISSTLRIYSKAQKHKKYLWPLSSPRRKWLDENLSDKCLTGRRFWEILIPGVCVSLMGNLKQWNPQLKEFPFPECWKDLKGKEAIGTREKYKGQRERSIRDFSLDNTDAFGIIFSCTWRHVANMWNSWPSLPSRSSYLSYSKIVEEWESGRESDPGRHTEHSWLPCPLRRWHWLSTVVPSLPELPIRIAPHLFTTCLLMYFELVVLPSLLNFCPFLMCLGVFSQSANLHVPTCVWENSKVNFGLRRLLHFVLYHRCHYEKRWTLGLFSDTLCLDMCPAFGELAGWWVWVISILDRGAHVVTNNNGK